MVKQISMTHNDSWFMSVQACQQIQNVSKLLANSKKYATISTDDSRNDVNTPQIT